MQNDWELQFRGYTVLKGLASLSILILIAAFCTAPDEVAANTLSASNKMVEGFHIETFGALNALRDIAQRANVVIGVEAIQPERETRIAFAFLGGTAKT